MFISLKEIIIIIIIIIIIVITGLSRSLTESLSLKELVVERRNLHKYEPNFYVSTITVSTINRR